MEGVLDADEHAFARDGFLEEVAGAQFDGFDRVVNRGVAADHHDGQRACGFIVTDPREQLEAPDAGQEQINDDEVDGFLAVRQEIERLLARLRFDDVVAIAAKNHVQDATDVAFVIDDEHRRTNGGLAGGVRFECVWSGLRMFHGVRHALGGCFTRDKANSRLAHDENVQRGGTDWRAAQGRARHALMRALFGLARLPLIFAAVLAFALSLSGCDAKVGDASNAKLSYTEDARAAYEEAMRSYHSRAWDDAHALLSEVRKLFPYSRYATLAELRLADLNFEQEKYADAVSSYREFIQNHRMDKDVEYARYRIAKSLFRDIDETFLLPPAEERDQATAQEAYRELEAVLRDNPRSRYADDLLKMRRAVQGRLVRHELYVARFYLRQDMYPAAIARIDHAVKTYPGSDLEPEALVLKGETLLKMNQDEKARTLFQRVIDEYGGPFAVTARKYLAELDAREKRPSAATPKAAQGS